MTVPRPRPVPQPVLLQPLTALHRTKRRARRPQTGIQSLEAGLGVLQTLVSAGRPVKLRDLAAAAGMSPSKAHRYLVSLSRSGLAAQEADGAYRLGPYALDMALACLNSLQPIRLASEALDALAREVGLTVAVAAWGNRGPTIVRIEESSHAVTMNVRAGTVVPLTRSASGLVFAAFMPRHVVAPLIAAELASRQRAPFERTLARVRQTGVGVVEQKLVPGADALAVPVFDHRGAIVLSLLAVGASGTFSVAAQGSAAQALKRHAAKLSKALGLRNPLLRPL